jgi:hypothetical protein
LALLKLWNFVSLCLSILFLFNFGFCQLWLFPTFKVCNFGTLQLWHFVLFNYDTLHFGTLQLWQFATLALCKFVSQQFWQYAILAL